MLLHKNGYYKLKFKKSLSMNPWISGKFITHIPNKKHYAKALQCVRVSGSFTVEAAFAVPIFLFAVVVFLGLFLMMLVQIQVTGALQYASRVVAASCQDIEEETQDFAYLIKSRVLFQEYLTEHGCKDAVIEGGMAGISLLGSDFSGEYITLRASYCVNLPVSFWNFRELPVQQCVKSRKWTGMETGTGDAGEGYVYVTPSGSAYHSSTSCSYLDLSIRSISVSQIDTLRSRSGSIYYPCSCYRQGAGSVYITDYGTKYHSNLGCSGLKRTIYRIKLEEVGSRHPCAKCYGGT